MTFNLNEEVRDGYRVPAEMKRIWQVELDLLERFTVFCKAHNLRMWVDGGTLLGAVRHKGFIPWDDDVDVVMPRADYDRMLRLAPQYFEAPYFLQSAYTDTDYFRGHAQLRRSDTAAIRPSDAFQPFNQGIFIDIFVLDAAPDDVAVRRDIIRRATRVFRYLKAKNTAILYSGRLGLIGRKWRCRREVARRGWAAIYSEAEDVLRTTAGMEARCWAELSFSGDDILFDKHLFDETVWLDFEHLKVPAVKDYDRFLRTQYGDNYMTPVQQPNYHGTLVFDTTRSYRDVLPEVRRAYRRSALKRLWKKLSGRK